jgi:hypothetical protein
MSGDYQLVTLANGGKTLFSASYGEKMHPGLGPAAEAELLYVRQLKIRERLQNHRGQFVIWDVGLGAAANAIAALRAARDLPGELHLISFDNSSEPLEFAMNNGGELGYIGGYATQLMELLHERSTVFKNCELAVNWDFHLGDFPAIVSSSTPGDDECVPKSEIGNRKSEIPAPHGIFYDAFSPAKNPAMWTLPVFENLFRALDPARPCALTTYSRSTMVRATLLLAGFFVGVGHATGLKEETTIAANTLELIDEPLDARWLERAARSDSAEPLHQPVYSRSPASPGTMAKLWKHPQFSESAG